MISTAHEESVIKAPMHVGQLSLRTGHGTSSKRGLNNDNMFKVWTDNCKC